MRFCVLFGRAGLCKAMFCSFFFLLLHSKGRAKCFFPLLFFSFPFFLFPIAGFSYGACFSLPFFVSLGFCLAIASYLKDLELLPSINFPLLSFPICSYDLYLWELVGWRFFLLFIVAFVINFGLLIIHHRIIILLVLYFISFYFLA